MLRGSAGLCCSSTAKHWGIWVKEVGKRSVKDKEEDIYTLQPIESIHLKKKKTVDPYFNPGPLHYSLVITVSYSLIILTQIITLPPYMWSMLLCSFDCSWRGFGDNIFMTLCNRLKFVAATSLCLTR